MHKIIILSCLLLTAACVTNSVQDPVAKHPDFRIVVAPDKPNSKRYKAYAPECPAWTKHRPDPHDNMPQPQIGCANQRNLALMIDRPTDLVGQRKLGAGNGTQAALGVQRYHENKVLGLYDANQPPPAKE